MGKQGFSVMQAEIFSVSVSHQMCVTDLAGRKTVRYSFLAIPGWAARLRRTLSDSFFNSVEGDTEATHGVHKHQQFLCNEKRGQFFSSAIFSWHKIKLNPPV